MTETSQWREACKAYLYYDNQQHERRQFSMYTTIAWLSVIISLSLIGVGIGTHLIISLLGIGGVLIGSIGLRKLYQWRAQRVAYYANTPVPTLGQDEALQIMHQLSDSISLEERHAIYKEIHDEIIKQFS